MKDVRDKTRMIPENEILVGDALEVLRGLPESSVHCCVTSPPYWGLRDYGVKGQVGLEKTPEEYVSRLVEVLREVRRILRGDGTLWLNLGDSYCAPPNSGTGWESSTLMKPDGRPRRAQIAQQASMRRGREFPFPLKPKDLVGVPWRVAFALQADGWYLRSDIIWSKPNPMPESVTDRPTKAHEYIFLVSKSERYYYDAEAIREADAGWDHPRNVLHKPEPSGGILQPHHGIRKASGRNGDGRNRRTVWDISTHPFPEAHFAVFPEKLVEPCILAGCPERGVVLDPFIGSGTTALVALKAGRRFIGIELNPEYAKMAERRIWQEKSQARLM